MKNRYSLALLTIIACLTSAQSIIASQAETVETISEEAIQTAAKKLDLAKQVYEKKVQTILSEISSKRAVSPEIATKVLSKAGFSKCLAILAIGYYLGMHHKEIEKGFDEQVRPALTLDNLPTKEQAEEFVNKSATQAKEFIGQSTEYLKNEFKKAALKNPEQGTKTESDQENQNN